LTVITEDDSQAKGDGPDPEAITPWPLRPQPPRHQQAEAPIIRIVLRRMDRRGRQAEREVWIGDTDASRVGQRLAKLARLFPAPSHDQRDHAQRHARARTERLRPNEQKKYHWQPANDQRHRASGADAGAAFRAQVRMRGETSEI